jgi:hypothetical protein
MGNLPKREARLLESESEGTFRLDFGPPIFVGLQLLVLRCTPVSVHEPVGIT